MMPKQRRNDQIDHMLGDLEAPIMRLMWTRPRATVREVRDLLDATKRPLAYTTVMTVMSRLAAKGILAREKVGKTHVYHARMTEEEIVREAATRRVETLVAEFGDLAIAQFLATVNDLSPERRRQLERLSRGETS